MEVDKKKKVNDKLSWHIDSKSAYIHCSMKDRFNKPINVDYHGYIFGLVGMQKFKKENQEHSLILIDGLPGSGKSTFVEGISALDSAFMGLSLNIDDIAWSMDNLINMMDSSDNPNRTIWADEFIQGTGRFNQSSIGLKLKIGFVTKRLKKNTYYLVVDELKEFPEKVIKMADAYIHIKKIGFRRGYFDCWTNPDVIFALWKQFKDFNSNWHSPFISRYKPDCKGKFSDYRGLFLDVVEFDRLKMEQTQQGDDKGDIGNITITKRMMEALELKRANPDLTYREMGLTMGVHEKTIGDWIRRLRNFGME